MLLFAGIILVINFLTERIFFVPSLVVPSNRKYANLLKVFCAQTFSDMYMLLEFTLLKICKKIDKEMLSIRTGKYMRVVLDSLACLVTMRWTLLLTY